MYRCRLGLTLLLFWATGYLLEKQRVAEAGNQEGSGGEETGVDQWPHWRGPTANGLADRRARPPIHWDAKTNVAWVAELPGKGSATPIVLGDQVFVLSAEKTSRKSPVPVINEINAKTVPDEYFYRFIVTSLDRTTGKTRWQKVVTEQVPHQGLHPTNTYAAGSPTTDGERLYIPFGSRGIFCFDLEGNPIWEVDLGDMSTRYGWGEAVTAVLAGELLIINWDQEADSFIIALSKHTGQTVWKTERPGEVTSWNTPLATSFGGKSMIIVNGTQSVKAYDSSSGQVLWSCGGQTTNAIPSPLRFGDTAICMSGYRGSIACAIPLSSRGVVDNPTGMRWKLEQGTPYVPSPIISGRRLLFTTGNTNVFTCVDADTGKILNSPRRLPEIRSMYASPILAAGHFYYTGRRGTTVVVKDNAQLDVVSINSLDDSIDASPVVVQDSLFLRSWTKLYCLRDTPSSDVSPAIDPPRTFPKVDPRD